MACMHYVMRWWSVETKSLVCQAVVVTECQTLFWRYGSCGGSDPWTVALLFGVVRVKVMGRGAT